MKTKRHKSLAVLSLVFIKLFFERDFILTIEEVIEHFKNNRMDMTSSDSEEAAAAA